jgi:uncharacterized protein involved in exopolysaccharide biosynthesis
MSGAPYVPARPVAGPPPPPSQWDGPQDELFDWQRVRSYVLFSLRSVRRRPFLFASVFAGMVLLAGGALRVLPKTYEVESRLLAQKSAVLMVRADSNMEQPTRAAAELILDRENLNSLIRQTDLISEWPKRRAPLARLKDRIMLRLFGKVKEEDMLEALRGFLEKNLSVWTTVDGTVTIRLHWPDGQMAYRLVDAAEQNFLEKRHVLEISTIAEQILILEKHAAELEADLEKQVAGLQELRDRARPAAVRALPRPAVPKSVRPEVLNLRVMLETKRRAIADLEAFRERHLLELQTRLTEQRGIYSENHPMVVDLQQTIRSLQRESPQVTSLRQEEADLRRQLATFGDEAAAPAPAVNLPPDLFRSERNEDSSTEYAATKLIYAAQQYAGMRDRVQAARLDLDTARAAFKYRYSVIVPPEVPRGPIKPKVPLVMAAAVMAGLALALFATTAADLRSGALLELWQLQSLLAPATAIVEVKSR